MLNMSPNVFAIVRYMSSQNQFKFFYTSGQCHYLQIYIFCNLIIILLFIVLFVLPIWSVMSNGHVMTWPISLSIWDKTYTLQHWLSSNESHTSLDLYRGQMLHNANTFFFGNVFSSFVTSTGVDNFL